MLTLDRKPRPSTVQHAAAKPALQHAVKTPPVNSLWMRLAMSTDAREAASTFRDTAPGHAVLRKCASCENEEENLAAQRKSASRDAVPEEQVGPAVGAAVRSPGRALDEGTRQKFESLFGHQFDQVRVHDDDTADASARALRATAFAAGNHLVFRRGVYAPGTPAGDHLIAHELTHTVQQSSTEPHIARARSVRGLSEPGDPAEVEADQIADAVTAGRPLPETPRALADGGLVHRQDEEESEEGSGSSSAAGAALAAAAVLAADDVTGIGVADDVAIPFLLLFAAIASSMTEICPVVKIREQENGFTQCIYQCRGSRPIRVVGPGASCPPTIVKK